jgi:hypothetical protein
MLACKIRKRGITAKEVQLGEYRVEKREPGGTVLIASEMLGECVYHDDNI